MSEGPSEPIESSITPDEANRIIHSHRKVRYGTACWPCRQRKVKCDNKHPCENCVKRDHALLCSYNPKNRDLGKTIPTAIAGVKRARTPDSNSEHSGRREDDRWPRTTGKLIPQTCTLGCEAVCILEVGLGFPALVLLYVGSNEDDPNESRYLGQNSIAAFLSEETQAGSSPGDGEHDVIRKDIMPILGLQISSAPYPFMSKEHMDKIRHDIASALPSDRDVLKSFQIYKQIVQPFWGLLIDIDDFESKLCIYLEERSSSAKRTSPKQKGVSSAWLGMLFAVLAVASNYAETTYHKRVAAAQSYGMDQNNCTSFHCLRLSNFLIRPSLDSLQALLILGFVLANDMKAEASWALIGLTCRLAQALGLHRGPNENGRITSSDDNDLPRRKLWWTIVWQDSLLSLSFDRTPIAVITRCQVPLRPTALTEGFTYTEAMYHLCQRVLDFVKNDSTNSQPDYNQIIANSIEVENIRQKVLPALRIKEACKTVQDRLQYFAVRLHTSFVVSVLCRPALRRGAHGMDISQKAHIAEKCKQNLTETVRMYLKMHSLSVIPTRSWAFTYHGLSSAVLLGILGETKTDPEVRQLQGELISALSATAAKEQPSTVPKSDKDIELSGPLSRALVALKNIYDHGWVVEQQRVMAPEAQTMQDGVPKQDQTDYEHQNAALAMASMQNGMVPPMEYAPQLTMGMGDIQSVEQTLNMSPMDLFDSIFWEPYPQTGIESGYDFTGGAFYPPF
ncbi:fungal specific transcription factor domain-containing protein [Rutstroemia sp. NJR-2017a WRK4]|nr:fungal specific transcription factor domain-containing protein [Rutstroemia sp. NJR-2017a WRK4]